MKSEDLPIEGSLAALTFRGRLTGVELARVTLTMADGSQLIVHPRHIAKCRMADDLHVRDIVRAANGELYVFVDPAERRPWLRLRGKWWERDADVPRPLRLLIRDGEFVDDPLHDDVAETPAPRSEAAGLVDDVELTRAVPS